MAGRRGPGFGGGGGGALEKGGGFLEGERGGSLDGKVGGALYGKGSEWLEGERGGALDGARRSKEGGKLEMPFRVQEVGFRGSRVGDLLKKSAEHPPDGTRRWSGADASKGDALDGGGWRTERGRCGEERGGVLPFIRRR